MTTTTIVKIGKKYVRLVEKSNIDGIISPMNLNYHVREYSLDGKLLEVVF